MPDTYKIDMLLEHIDRLENENSRLRQANINLVRTAREMMRTREDGCLPAMHINHSGKETENS